MDEKELKSIMEREQLVEETIEAYLSARETREAAQANETDLFNKLNKLARPAGDNRRIATAQTRMITFKERENIRVDHTRVNDLWGVVAPGIIDGITADQFPFLKKWQPDKPRMEALRTGDPDAYAELIAPLITITPGKPTAEVKEIDQI